MARTPAEVITALVVLYGSQKEAGKVLGRDQSTVSRWQAGQSPVDAAALKLAMRLIGDLQRGGRK